MTAADASARVVAQVRFLLEIDRVKQVVRHNPLADGSRPRLWELAQELIATAEEAGLLAGEVQP